MMPSPLFTSIAFNTSSLKFINEVNSLNILDSEGYLVVNESLETRVPGMFAAGDCVKKSLRQIVTAVSDGAIAATSAIKYLQKIK